MDRHKMVVLSNRKTVHWSLREYAWRDLSNVLIGEDLHVG